MNGSEQLRLTDDGQDSKQVTNLHQRRERTAVPLRPVAGLRRLAVVPNEAAELLGVSRDFFDEHVRPELKTIRRGSKTVLIPVTELERWVAESAVRLRA